MAVYDPKFGTRSLAGIATAWNDIPARRVVGIQIPRRPGIIVETAVPGGRMITMAGRLMGTTAQDLRDKETLLWADLHAGKQNLQIFDDRFIKAQVQGTQRGLRTSRRLDFQAVFLAEEPYWQSAILNSQTENVISVPHAFSVTNAGNAKTSPIVTVTANTTVTLAKLKHVGQDETMQYDLTLNATDVLVIDVAAGTVKVNGANKLAGFSGTFWRLDPGANSLEYDGTQPVDVKVEWRDQWE